MFLQLFHMKQFETVNFFHWNKTAFKKNISKLDVSHETQTERCY